MLVRTDEPRPIPSPPRMHNPVIVTSELAGMRVEDFLKRTWPDVDHRSWRQLVREGGVRVNSEKAQGRLRLRAGDSVELKVSPASLRSFSAKPDDVISPEVIHEEPGLLVVNKPAGIPTIPDRAGKYEGVLGMIREQRPDEDLRVVHRLDRDTSGCLLLARDLDAARSLDIAFRGGQIEKTYLALVEGAERRERFEINKALGPDLHRPGKIRVVAPDSRGARAAHTVVEVAERFVRHTLLRVFPRTGRSHQIRVHLRQVGCPIVADRDYGSGPEFFLSEIKHNYKIRQGIREKPLLTRMFLHAHKIVVPAMAGGEPVSVESPLPSDLELVLAKLRHFSPFRTD